MASRSGPPRQRQKRTARPPTPPTRAKAKAIERNTFAGLAGAVRKDVDGRLGSLLSVRVAAVKPLGREVTDLVTAIRDLCLRGGKRTRAALLVAGYRAASRSAPLEPALDAGVALELLHVYFLIHDDWMDEDTIRRGGPAVHAWLASRLRSRRLGERAGVLAGDLAVAYAQQALARVDVPRTRLPAALAAFAEMQEAAVLGQQLDVVGKGTNIEKVYELKTASYTVRGPLRLGALLAGGSPKLLETLDRFATPAGIAFQLRDDLLSAFGDPAQTGKPLGSDLKSGKKTPLLQLGLRRARGKDHRLLEAVVGNAKARPSDLQKAIDVLERSGAREAVEKRIEQLLGSALAQLGSASLSADARELLGSAARAMAARVT